MKYTALLFLQVFVSSCSIHMGNIPIIVKEDIQDKTDTIDFAKIEAIRSKGPLMASYEKDCLHMFVFVPTKIYLDFHKVISQSCPKSPYSFDNNIKDRFFYLLYGKECLINEAKCPLD